MSHVNGGNGGFGARPSTALGNLSWMRQVAAQWQPSAAAVEHTHTQSLHPWRNPKRPFKKQVTMFSHIFRKLKLDFAYDVSLFG